MKASLFAIPISLLLFSSLACADGMSYREKQQLSCKAIASAISSDANKRGLSVSESMKVYNSSKAICEQSYNQASAEYPIEKARNEAITKAGEIAGLIVEMSYESYDSDNK